MRNLACETKHQTKGFFVLMEFKSTNASYEVMYVLRPDIAEGAYANAISKFEKTITESGGEVVNTEHGRDCILCNTQAGFPRVGTATL